jgi:hypothetical protein
MAPIPQTVEVGPHSGMSGIVFSYLPLMFTVLVFFVWIGALVDVIKSRFAGNKKIIWIIVVIFLPVIGAILYLSIGKKQKI